MLEFMESVELNERKYEDKYEIEIWKLRVRVLKTIFSFFW